MIGFPYTLEILILISTITGIGLTLSMSYKVKKINPNLYYENRILKEKTQKVLKFILIFTMIGWGFAFGSAAFAIGNLSIFMIFEEWILGIATGKFFIMLAIAAVILFYFQKAYFFIKDNAD